MTPSNMRQVTARPPVMGGMGRLTHFVAIGRNITEAKQRLEELAQTNRALQMLTRCNEAVIKVEYEQELLEQICRLAVDVGGYEAAWAGDAPDDHIRSMRQAHAGK